MFTNNQTVKFVAKKSQRNFEEDQDFQPKGRKLNKTQRGTSNKRNWSEEL